MRVVGFTFIRNAVEFDYPICEAVRSILDLCDEVIIAVGESTDDTAQLVASIDSPKVRVINTVWDDSQRKGGRILAIETDKAYAAIPDDTDWCVYIQGDEILHETSIPILKAAMQKYLYDARTEGLLVNYKHFYGSYDYIGASRYWYRKEIRVLRKQAGIHAHGDAQGFRHHNRKLYVRQTDAVIHHYGWVKHPEAQQRKAKNFNKFWHSDEVVAEMVPDVTEFDYSKIDDLLVFTGTHPVVMQKRISMVNWKFSFDPTQRKLSVKERISRFIENLTGWRIGEYKNYLLIKE